MIMFDMHFTCRVRTSSGTFLTRGQDKIIRGIEKRLSDFTFLPVGMQFEKFLSCGSLDLEVHFQVMLISRIFIFLRYLHCNLVH